MSKLTLVAALLALPVTLSAQRPTGVVGEYVPPRTWAQGEHNYDLVHQRIAVQFDEAERLVTGEVTTTVVAQAATDTIRLNAENISIDAATDAAGSELRFSSDTSHVTVHLPSRAASGDTVVFTLAYHTHPERGIYFVPRRHVVWSQGEATETRAWVPTYDHPNDKTTWEILVTADSSLKVLSNGALVETTPVHGGAQKTWHWSQTEPASTYLYSVVVGPFTVLYDRWRDKPVDYWVYPDTVDAGWRAFGETPSMIELYSRLLSVPFPWDKYDQSAIPDFTYGGMENVSATTQTDGALAGPGNDPLGARGLVAHELAHQWFGDYITTANWANAWLNEGLTTYMASVHQEKTRGWAAAQLDWAGQQRQAMNADRNQPRPLVWGEYQGNDPIQLFFSGHVYPKGAQVAHQLRRLLGDETFWAGMHRFLVDNAHQPVTTEDYAVAFEKECNCDLDWFFDQWVYGIGYPQLEVTRHWDPGRSVLAVTVEQTQPVDSIHPLFKFPVTLRMTTPDAVLRADITVSNELETFEMRLPAEPLSFRFDEGGWLLGSVHTDQTVQELAAMAKHDLDVSGQDWALRALAESTDDAAVAARRFIALNEHAAPLRAEAVRQLASDTTAESTKVLRAALRDPDGSVRSIALRTMAQRSPDEMGPIALAAYEHDPNPNVRAAALGTYARVAGQEAIPTLLEATGSDNTQTIRATAAAALARTHDASALDALERLTDPSETRGLRQTGLNAVMQMGDTARTVALASEALDDYDPLFSMAAVRVLARLDTPDARAALEAAESSEQRVHVKAAIERALQGGS